jgi:hypothetical protein
MPFIRDDSTKRNPFAPNNNPQPIPGGDWIFRNREEGDAPTQGVWMSVGRPIQGLQLPDWAKIELDKLNLYGQDRDADTPGKLSTQAEAILSEVRKNACQKCTGHGYASHNWDSPNAGRADWELCPRCNGSGQKK